MNRALAVRFRISFSDIERFGRAATRQHNQEFLAAISPDRVIGPQSAAEELCYLAQCNIADAMAVLIVDLLEAIDVGECMETGVCSRAPRTRARRNTSRMAERLRSRVNPSMSAWCRSWSSSLISRSAALTRALQLIDIERLPNIVIGTGIQTSDNVFGVGLHRQHDDVRTARPVQVA